ncbi:regulator of G-protein signaling 21-like [Amblyraja radiata]|uniref:regulator of G-protein signaling 21-like n=1 Tax=Amblyraja radiata TaxID=386614 RepID=UPI001403D051|nr:regulator of G-protein signaling 21-like [Amblyraja radiata]
MQTVLYLFPQLNLSAPKEEPYQITKPQKQEGTMENNNRHKDKRHRLSLLLHKADSGEILVPLFRKPEKTYTCLDEHSKWGECLNKLLVHKSGLTLFRAFLQSEHSEENIDFWLACENYRKTKSLSKLSSKAKKIYSDFISTDAPKEVNLDFHTKEVTKKNIVRPTLSCFDLAQKKVHTLMEKDSYPRFLKSKLYRDLLLESEAHNCGPRRRSHSFTSIGVLQAQSDFTFWL